MSDSVIFVQTSDPYRYSSMLALTSRTVKHYCRSKDYKYESYVGIKRGFYPWQASFNRIYILDELIARGHEGWVAYLDADAYIVGFDFDLEKYLASFHEKAFIAAPSGTTQHLWDINNGVFFINLGHLSGIKIVRQWRRIFETADTDFLRRCTDFYMGIDDQAMLHEVLDNLREYQDIFVQCDWNFINSPFASFIRQQLRAMHSTFEERIANIESNVSLAMEATLTSRDA